MTGWALLIPPSESKAEPAATSPVYREARKEKRRNSFKFLDEQRTILMKVVGDFVERGVGLDRLLDVSGDSLGDAIKWNRDILDARSGFARDVYNGVMYQALDYKSLKGPQKKLFDQNSLIISGLYGLLKPKDFIAPYKLKISANVGGAIGKLTHYWRRPVSELLRAELRGKVVWDFLPDQHRRVWDSTGEIAARHHVRFVKRVVRGGVAEYKTISHHSKSLKGSLIRHLLARNATLPRELFDFEHPDGYRYNRELSVTSKRESVLVFAAD